MIVSEARIAANRRNALKSTGPKTIEGKEKSRVNALKHGLCSTTIVPETAREVETRAYEWFGALKPQNQFHTWLVDEIAVISLRIDRTERIERRLRNKLALRAELTWDDDRRLETEILGAMLAKRPAETVETLQRSPHGCDWLMNRWAMLAHAADSNGGQWTEDQVRLAFDLLATPREFRNGSKPGRAIDLDGTLVDSGADLAAVARRELVKLKERRDLVADLDEVERSLAEADLSFEEPELRKLRRYEASLHRRLQWCLAQINHPSPHQHPHPGLKPKWTEEPEPAPAPEPPTEAEIAAETQPANDPHPPFDLKPDEFPAPGQTADIPAILQSLREKRVQQSDTRREAKRRKLERLRA